MEATIEVRWFIRGIPPIRVQNWFKFECPGKLFGELETRKDLYACIQANYLDKFARFSSHQLTLEEVNLKLRQGNPELKLRQQKFGTYKFSHSKHLHTCKGNVEQWYKFEPQELTDFNLLNGNLLDEFNWVSIDKEREQKIEQGVKIELTRLKIDGEYWWSIAFEMTQDYRGEQPNSRFKEVVTTACQTYYEGKLSAINSYGYSQWLLEFLSRNLPHQKDD